MLSLIEAGIHPADPVRGAIPNTSLNVAETFKFPSGSVGQSFGFILIPPMVFDPESSDPKGGRTGSPTYGSVISFLYLKVQRSLTKKFNAEPHKMPKTLEVK